jgi:hypothetical protein
MDPESCVADQGFAVRRDGDERRGCQRQLVSVRHCDPCSRISPIPTWEQQDALLRARTGVIGAGWSSLPQLAPALGTRHPHPQPP